MVGLSIEDIRMDLVRPISDARMDTGPITPEEISYIKDLVASDLMSRETAMVMVGIEDPDSEKALISAENEDMTFVRRKEVWELLTKSGYTLAPEQLGEADDMIGIQQRNMQVVREKMAMDMDMQREQLRSMQNQADPAEDDL
jgi:hypothetical protein